MSPSSRFFDGCPGRRAGGGLVRAVSGALLLLGGPAASSAAPAVASTAFSDPPVPQTPRSASADNASDAIRGAQSTPAGSPSSYENSFRGFSWFQGAAAWHGDSPAVAPDRIAAAEGAFDHAFAAYGTLLKEVVVGDSVDYDKVRARLPALKARAASIASLPPERFEAFSRDQQLAFWINAYNLHILRVVAEAGPVKSIKDVPNVFSGSAFTVVGRELTFDRLEHEVIRARFKEPRVHFALNCAARSCPPLRAEPFRADRLEAQLESSAAAFVRDPRHNRVDPAAKAIHLSKLFQWFGEDFIERYGAGTARAGYSPAEAATLSFVARYLEKDASTFVREGAPKITYLEYDWSLNSVPRR